MPLSALFILFDFVIHCPAHPDIRKNLILLDIVSGHFSLLEHASRGSLPGNYLSRFAHIARQHVENVARQPVDNTRTDSTAMVEGGEHHQDTSSRADVSVGHSTELNGVCVARANSIHGKLAWLMSNSTDRYVEISLRQRWV
jgi:hypothetical protein